MAAFFFCKLIHNSTSEFLIFTSQAGEQRSEARNKGKTLLHKEKMEA